MITTPRVILSGIGLVLVTWSCVPPCDPLPSNPQSVCRRADAGAIVPDASFILEGVQYSQNATCLVTIDGGQIDLYVGRTEYCGSHGTNEIRAPDNVQFTIPPLAAGTYVVNSATPTTFTIPESADAGVPVCP